MVHIKVLMDEMIPNFQHLRYNIPPPSSPCQVQAGEIKTADQCGSWGSLPHSFSFCAYLKFSKIKRGGKHRFKAQPLLP